MSSTTSYSQIVAKTWADPTFRKKLIDNPRQVLADHGFHVPDSMDIAIKPGGGKGRLELPLPDKPGTIDGEALHTITHISDWCC